MKEQQPQKVEIREEEHLIRPETDKEARASERGFTLIELVIVIAIIGILAAGYALRGVNAITDAQVTSVSEAVANLKTGIVQYTVKNGTLPASVGAIITAGFLDKDPTQSVSVGTGTTYGVVAAGTAAGATPVNGYDLDGNGTAETGTTTSNQQVIELTINGVAGNDAFAISKQIDGVANSSSATTADSKGVVEYAAPTAGTTTVKIFLASK